MVIELDTVILDWLLKMVKVMATVHPWICGHFESRARELYKRIRKNKKRRKYIVFWAVKVHFCILY